MGPSIAVHGGMRFRGGDPEIANLDLEKLEEDPINPDSSRIWFNTTLKRIAYAESTDPGGLNVVIRYLNNNKDLADLLARLAEKADVSAITSIAPLSRTNIGTEDLVFGQAVYSLGGSAIKLANAGVLQQKDVLGLVADDLIESQTGSGNIQTSGQITGTIAQWTMATGMVGGLVPNSNYFLDIVSGQLTMIPPSGLGQYLCPIGRALTPTVFEIKIERTIAL